MERAAFARARQFLNYHPVAKWSALLAAVGAGILFVGLLVVLAFFTDLMVNRGEIPCYARLSPPEKQHFRNRDKPAEEAIQRELDELALAVTSPLGVSPADLEEHPELAWLVELPILVEQSVNEDAAERVRQRRAEQVQALGVQVATHQNLKDFGILSLVVRNQSSVQGTIVGYVASWNHWMWAEGNDFYLQGLCLAALVLAAVRTGLMTLGSVAAARATIEAVTRLRRAVYHHTYRLGTLAFRALGPAEAVGVSTRHLEAVHDGLFTWLTVVFREPVKFALVLVLALLVHFWLALAFLLFALLVWILGGQVAAYFRRQGRAALHRAADQLALLQESLMLMRLIKVYLMETFNQARVERQLSKYASAQLRRYRGEAIYRPLLSFLAFLAALVLLFVMGIVILEGQVGVTTALVLATALVSLYWPVVSWLEHRRYLRRARASALVVFRFLDRPGAIGQAADAEFLPAMTKHLEFDDVTLHEPGSGRPLLRGIHLRINAGQHVAVVGPDDMEKHALVYLIPRFLDPTSGEIRIDRKNLRWVTLDSLRVQTAVVLQHNLVFNDTVANNIGGGDPSYPLPRIIEAAKMAHAHQFISSLPQGYETFIGEMGHPLSISERFRIALARAVLRDPALLIIEEPGVPLDDDTKALVDDSYNRILPGRTAIFLPHRLSTIRRCDRVFLLYQGRIEGVGDHRELLQSSELYRHLQYLEFNEFAGLLQGGVPLAAPTEA